MVQRWQLVLLLFFCALLLSVFPTPFSHTCSCIPVCLYLWAWQQCQQEWRGTPANHSTHHPLLYNPGLISTPAPDYSASYGDYIEYLKLLCFALSFDSNSSTIPVMFIHLRTHLHELAITCDFLCFYPRVQNPQRFAALASCYPSPTCAAPG